MRVFIAGATGAIGVPVVKRLVADGHEVIGLTRKDRGRALLESLGARAVIGDALDAESLQRIVIEARPTHVVHLLTALPKEGPRRAKDFAATNELRIRGTANLLRAAIAAGAKRIVAESFPAVYGFRREANAALTEDSPLGPITGGETREVVEALRSLEEQMANASDRIETIVLRYGYLYGASFESTESLFDMLRKRKLPLIRGSRGVGSFLNIDDAAAATIAALERGEPGSVYNIVDDSPVALADFFSFAADAIGAPKPPRVPAFVLRLLAPAVVQYASAQLPLSNAKAKRELGFSPRYPSYREGLPVAARASGRPRSSESWTSAKEAPYQRT